MSEPLRWHRSDIPFLYAWVAERDNRKAEVCRSEAGSWFACLYIDDVMLRRAPHELLDETYSAALARGARFVLNGTRD